MRQQEPPVDLGAEVTLYPGATVAVKHTELTVQFISVTEDSRCPRDVNCIWAGEVKVMLEIQQVSQVPAQVEIAAGGSTVAGAYRVTLLRVEPQRMSAERIAPDDYRATLKIDQAAD